MKIRNSILTLIAAGWLIAGGSVQATLVGNDPYSYPTGGSSSPSDGVSNLLSIQNQNPFPAAGTVDAFSFYRGAGNSPFSALIFRHTGNLNEYTVIYDSGNLNLGAAPYNAGNGVYTNSFAPVSVLAGDVIGHYGWGIAYNAPTVGEDTAFYPAGPKPSGTFTAPSGNYSLYDAGGREYMLAFEFTQAIPEPSTLLLCGSGGLLMWYRRRKV